MVITRCAPDRPQKLSASIKQLTLAVSLLKVQSNRVLDDLAEMFIKRMSIIAQRFFGLAAAPAG
jgi:hypothetical protein